MILRKEETDNAMTRWVKRIMLAALMLFLALIAFLLINEAFARRKYWTEYPPPGETVSL